MDLRIAPRKSGKVTILDVRGRIVIGANSDLFKAELRTLAESTPCDVLVNLAEVTQVDSTGISALVQSFVTLKRDGGSLKILNPAGFRPGSSGGDGLDPLSARLYRRGGRPGKLRSQRRSRVASETPLPDSRDRCADRRSSVRSLALALGARAGPTAIHRAMREWQDGYR